MGRGGNQSERKHGLHALLEQDRKLGLQINTQSSQRKPLSLAATVLGLSADEAVWFPLPLVLTLCGVLTGRTGAELFGDVCMVAFVEQAAKYVFKRTRPTYAKQSSFYCILGEWYSFPSGHTMRTAFLSHIFRRAFPDDAGLGPTLLFFVWPVLVGWARVAKGKHYPLDTLVGFISGVALAEARARLGEVAWAAVKYIAGTVFTVEAVLQLAVPAWRLEGTPVHIVVNVLWLGSLFWGCGPPWLRDLLQWSGLL